MSAGPNVCGSQDVIGLRRLSALPGWGSLAVLPPACATDPNPNRPFIRVGYSLRAVSRLGYSPNFPFDAAYHTTSCKSGGTTNLFFFAKSPQGSPPPLRAPGLAGRGAFFRPVAQCPSRLLRPGKHGHTGDEETIPTIPISIARSKKRTNYMSNVIFPLPPLAKILPPSSEPCGALATQRCLAPAPATPGESTPSAVPLPAKPASTPPAPRQSARCPVKGCVFPAPLEGQTMCHYHELLESEGELFQSHQPSHLLALHAPFGIPDTEPDDSRYKDRERQAAEREAFLLDDAA